jgi:hypothetical protein
VLEDLHPLTWPDSERVEVSEELTVLCQDSNDDRGLSNFEFVEAYGVLIRHRAIFLGNRIAVWVGFRESKEFVDSIREFIAHRVLKPLCLIVNLVPLVTKYFSEKYLDEAVFPDHVQCGEVPLFCEPSPLIRLMLDEPCSS